MNTEAALNAKNHKNTVEFLQRLIPTITNEADVARAEEELAVRIRNLGRAEEIAHFTAREMHSYRQLFNRCNYTHAEAMELVESQKDEINAIEPQNLKWHAK